VTFTGFMLLVRQPEFQRSAYAEMSGYEISVLAVSLTGNLIANRILLESLLRAVSSAYLILASLLYSLISNLVTL